MGVLSTVVKATAHTVDLVRRPAPGLTVLIYHRVGGRTPVRVDLPTSMFDEQMAWLVEHRRVLDLGSAVAGLERGDDQRDAVVVTFDDGTDDLVEEALPVLERYDVPATVYVATAFVEDRVDFPDQGRPVSWRGLGDALATGLVTVGSHTHRHRLLDRLEPDDIVDELDRSVGLIGDRLGVAADHFAYPKALAPSPAADRAVRSRFRSAALAGTRANPVGADPYLLARSPIQTTDAGPWFGRKVAGGLGLEDDLRRFVNRRRYAGAVS